MSQSRFQAAPADDIVGVHSYSPFLTRTCLRKFVIELVKGRASKMRGCRQKGKVCQFCVPPLGIMKFIDTVFQWITKVLRIVQREWGLPRTIGRVVYICPNYNNACIAVVNRFVASVPDCFLVRRRRKQVHLVRVAKHGWHWS